MIFRSNGFPIASDTKSGLAIKNFTSISTANQLDVKEYAIKLASADLLFSNNDFSSSNANSLSIPIQFKISNGQPCQNPYYKNMDFFLYILENQAGKQNCYQYVDKNSIPDDPEEAVIDERTVNKTISANATSPQYAPKDYNINAQLNFKNKTLFYDYSYYVVDKYYMENLYTENGITAITYNMPLFPKTIYQRDINLYAKNYFGLKTACLKRIQNENLAQELLDETSFVSSFLKDNDTLVSSLIFSIICLIIYIFLASCGCYCFTLKDRKTKKENKVSAYSIWTYFVFSIIFIGLILGYLIPLILTSRKSKVNTIFDTVFNDSNCVDSYTTDLYNFFVVKLILVKKLSFACIALSTFALFLLIIYSIYSVILTKKELYN